MPPPHSQKKKLLHAKTIAGIPKSLIKETR